jgi:hypothetical protein
MLAATPLAPRVHSFILAVRHARAQSNSPATAHACACARCSRIQTHAQTEQHQRCWLRWPVRLRACLHGGAPRVPISAMRHRTVPQQRLQPPRRHLMQRQHSLPRAARTLARTRLTAWVPACTRMGRVQAGTHAAGDSMEALTHTLPQSAGQARCSACHTHHPAPPCNITPTTPAHATATAGMQACRGAATAHARRARSLAHAHTPRHSALLTSSRALCRLCP